MNLGAKETKEKNKSIEEREDIFVLKYNSQEEMKKTICLMHECVKDSIFSSIFERQQSDSKGQHVLQ